MSVSTAAFHRGKHVIASQLYDSTSECPACGSVTPREKTLLLQKDPDVFLLSCSVCGAFSASHMPTPQALRNYYGSYYSGNAEGVTFHDIRRLGKQIFDSIINDYVTLHSPLRILDYGGGNGGLGLDIATRFREIGIVDIDVDVVDYGIEEIIHDGTITTRRFNDESGITGKYSMILASAVLEHVPQLKNLVSKFALGLMPRGYFYARTPYAVPFKKAFPFFDFTYPAHVHDLGPTFWYRFPRTFGLNWNAVLSGPSPVQTKFGRAPIRTTAATLMKIPTHLELLLRGGHLERPLWPFPGGWQVIYRSA